MFSLVQTLTMPFQIGRVAFLILIVINMANAEKDPQCPLYFGFIEDVQSLKHNANVEPSYIVKQGIIDKLWVSAPMPNNWREEYHTKIIASSYKVKGKMLMMFKKECSEPFGANLNGLYVDLSPSETLLTVKPDLAKIPNIHSNGILWYTSYKFYDY